MPFLRAVASIMCQLYQPSSLLGIFGVEYRLTIEFGSVDLVCKDCDDSGKRTVYQGRLKVSGERASYRNSFDVSDTFWGTGNCAIQAGIHHHEYPFDQHSEFYIKTGRKQIGILHAAGGRDIPDKTIWDLPRDLQELALDSKTHKI